MYGNTSLTAEEAKIMNATVEDADKLEAFEARIARGEKIEPGDWMPEQYRKQLIRMIEQHAHSEIVGALPEGTWITRAPNFKRKLALIAKVQDEIGHGQLLYSAAETLGKTREQMLMDLLSGKSKYSNVFNYPANTWADMAVIGFLVDGAAIVNQIINSKGSYGPYCRALERICYEESFHLKQGHDNFVYLATGTPVQRAMLQEALNRWYRPLLHFFGPSDRDSQHSEKLMKWRVKLASNDDMRNQFLDQYVPKIYELGLTLPDPELKKGDDGIWVFGDPDWDEFKRVINGDGPCNKERIEVRRYSELAHKWVREALLNPKEKYAVPMA
jgi:ring-1,2-phenylacetyl-CoA epoxidase subunit PaaA